MLFFENPEFYEPTTMVQIPIFKISYSIESCKITVATDVEFRTNPSEYNMNLQIYTHKASACLQTQSLAV